MIYVALLRGINVGGKKKVPMARLRSVFEELGFEGVRTYIASGNVVFASDRSSLSRMAADIEKGIADEFGFSVDVVVLTGDAIREIAGAIPDRWVNDGEMKTDVMYLWEEVDAPSVMDEITMEEGIDDVLYVPGALIWRTDRDQVKRSGRMKLSGTDLYKAMTVRNCNSARRLAEMVEEGDAG